MTDLEYLHNLGGAAKYHEIDFGEFLEIWIYETFEILLSLYDYVTSTEHW